ncbi:hypothetical protein E4U42_002849 [Claviceps africana]|uniref:DUF7703 domain-containing protein n=1 Tax=Claviceps africana TaxID=83212 RepID=A0A8K0J803_9HYPO|nr:hypothetical protein E4U42_002849 [Claviceps africana]
MGYSGNPSIGVTDGADEHNLTIVSFVALAIYNAVELNFVVFSTFTRFQGLYFWSFLAAANGIIPHSLGFFLKNVVRSDRFGLYITLVAVGWVPMVTGQALVLYSRLHLIFWNDTWLRIILAIIITNVFILHIPIIVLMYGANSSSSPDNPWIQIYVAYEKVQVTLFFLQELLISAVYIRSCFSFFDTRNSLYGDAVPRMRRHLILVNLLIILLDVPILFFEYWDYYDIQTAYKAFVYSVKLKMEFRILNRLVKMTSERQVSLNPFHMNTSPNVDNTSPAKNALLTENASSASSRQRRGP